MFYVGWEVIKNFYSRIINSLLKCYDISNEWVKLAVISSISILVMNPHIHNK
jgi:hypothetical protein